ncbi:MAG: hypothetical protein AAGG75_16515 [Bacteroidota bacterium]
MKKLFFAGFLSLLTLVLSAQVVSDMGVDNDVNLSQLGNLNPGTAGARGFDNRYEGAKGSPFLYEEEWPLGDVYFIDGKSIIGELRLNMDLVQNEVYAQLISGETMILFKEPIEKVVFKNGSEEVTYECRPTLAADRKKAVKKFYRVIHSGNYEVLKLPLKYFEKANFSGAYSPDVRHDSFTRQDEYYLKPPQAEHIRIKLKRTSLKKALPKRKKTIVNFLNRKKLYDIDEAALLALMDYLDTKND